MTVATEPQTRLDEEVLEDVELEQALRERQAAKEEAAEARKAYAAADEHVKAIIDRHELADGQAIRCGSWRISKRAVPSRSVSFETSPSSRVSIALLES